MTAKESKAVAWRIGVGFGAVVTEDAKLAARFVKDGYNVTPMVEESALHAAEAERDAFRKELLLMEHKVITCGVAASHPDKLLTTHGAYKTKWDSPQAQSVRELRDAKDAAEAELGELRRKVGELAGDLESDAIYPGNSHEAREFTADAAQRLRDILASDGGADGDNEGNP